MLHCEGPGVGLLLVVGFLGGVIFSMLVIAMFAVKRIEAIHMEKQRAENEGREVPHRSSDS